MSMPLDCSYIILTVQPGMGRNILIIKHIGVVHILRNQFYGIFTPSVITRNQVPTHPLTAILRYQGLTPLIRCESGFERATCSKFDLLLFNACLLKPFICLIKKQVLKSHWGNELNKKIQIGVRVKIKILIT